MFSEKEKEIVAEFYSTIDSLGAKKLRLSWQNGYAIAKFDTCFDDFAEEDETDEYTSFVFEIVDSKGEIPIEISSAGYTLINYHNFPIKIEVLE